MLSNVFTENRIKNIFAILSLTIEYTYELKTSFLLVRMLTMMGWEKRQNGSQTYVKLNRSSGIITLGKSISILVDLSLCGSVAGVTISVDKSEKNEFHSTIALLSTYRYVVKRIFVSASELDIYESIFYYINRWFTLAIINNVSFCLTLSLLRTRRAGDETCIFQRSFTPFSRRFQDCKLWNLDLALDFN